jgi:hypothetical protein
MIRDAGPVPVLGILHTCFRGLALTDVKSNTRCGWIAFGRTLPVGTGRHPSNGQVASSAITVRLRRPPHDHSMKLRCRLLQLFLMDGVLTGNIQPRLTTGLLIFGPKSCVRARLQAC